MKKPTSILVSLLAVVLASPLALAQPDSAIPSTTGRQTALSKGDQKFLTQAAQANLAEIESSKFAAQHATRSDVKEFASMLASEHQMSFGELSMLAERKGFSLPTSITRDQQGDYNKLVSKTGANLDKAFIKNATEAHQDTIDLYKNAAKDADDSDIKALASKQLPNLSQHLQASKRLQNSLD